MNLRIAHETEIDQLAKLWYEGWQDAHAQLLPEGITKHRTLSSFTDRLRADLPNLRVAGPLGQPLGICIFKGDELNQLYVAPAAWGSGIAADLLLDAEERIGRSGAQTAWLACAIGNKRAARFYEKHGWSLVCNMINELSLPDGMFRLEVWRFEKPLNQASQRPAVGVAHVVLQTDCMQKSAQFMQTIGMRSIFDGPEVSVYEMRSGTHLILMRKDVVAKGDAAFDLMVDDLHTTHERFKSMGLAPSPIEARPAIDHEVFTVQEPSGQRITFFSSHASGKPI